MEWFSTFVYFCVLMQMSKINLESTSHIRSSVGLSMSGTVRVESELVAFRPLLADGFHTRAPYCFNLSEITDRCSCNNMLSVFGICHQNLQYLFNLSIRPTADHRSWTIACFCLIFWQKEILSWTTKIYFLNLSWKCVWNMGLNIAELCRCRWKSGEGDGWETQEITWGGESPKHSWIGRTKTGSAVTSLLPRFFTRICLQWRVSTQYKLLLRFWAELLFSVDNFFSQKFCGWSIFCTDIGWICLVIVDQVLSSGLKVKFKIQNI